MSLLLAALFASPLRAAPIDLGPARDAQLRFGGLLAIQADLHFEPEGARPSFGVADARLRLGGDLPDDFEFFVQANLVLQPALLDLRLTWSPDPRIALDTGFIKVPFSVEFILDASALEFTERAQAVNALAPNRQVGALARGVAYGKRLQYALGVFNGNRSVLSNSDTGLLLAGRLATEWPLGGGRVEVGINGARSEDQVYDSPISGAFAGHRLLAGADTRLELGPWFLTSEIIWSRFDPDAGPAVEPFGYQVSSGYAFNPVWAIKARYDHLDPGDFGPVSDLIIAGVGPTWAVFSLWLDYIEPLTAEGGARRLLFTTQAYW